MTLSVTRVCSQRNPELWEGTWPGWPSSSAPSGHSRECMQPGLRAGIFEDITVSLKARRCERLTTAQECGGDDDDIYI